MEEFNRRFAIVEADYEEIQAERKFKEDEERIRLEELEKKTDAATIIQAGWRGYVVRQALAKAKKKKKRGKGKKGKKGKKK